MPAKKTSTPKVQSVSSSALESIGKQQLQVITQASSLLDKLTVLPEFVSQIKDQVTEIKEKYGYEIKEAEIEYQDKQKQLEQSFNEFALTLEERKKKMEEEIEQQKLQNEKLLENIRYQYSLAVRDEDMKTMQALAARYKKALVDSEEWNMKKDVVRLNEQELQQVKDVVIKETIQQMNQVKQQEMSEIKHNYELNLQLSKKDVEMLTKEAEKLRKDNADLQQQLRSMQGDMVRVAEAATRPTQIYEQKQK